MMLDDVAFEYAREAAQDEALTEDEQWSEATERELEREWRQ